jgi:hypothetical protein
MHGLPQFFPSFGVKLRQAHGAEVGVDHVAQAVERFAGEVLFAQPVVRDGQFFQNLISRIMTKNFL